MFFGVCARVIRCRSVSEYDSPRPLAAPAWCYQISVTYELVTGAISVRQNCPQRLVSNSETESCSSCAKL